MDVKAMLASLNREQERISRAIEALKPLNPQDEPKPFVLTPPPAAPAKIRVFSAAARRKISRAQKARWAKLKKAA